MSLKQAAGMGLLLLGMSGWLISCGNSSPTSNNPTATPTVSAATATFTPTPNLTVIANFGASTNPAQMAMDSQNNLYVALSGTVSIGKITSAGVTSAINTTTSPWTVSLDAAGDVFFSGSNAAGVTELPYNGGLNSLSVANTYAVLVNSASTTLFVSNGGGASAAISIATVPLNIPIGSGSVFGTVLGMTMDSNGNLFFADAISFDEIGEVTAASLSTGSPSPTLVAGPGTTGTGFVDGAGASAKFDGPEGIAVDSSNNLYVADEDNGAIRKISGGPGNWTVSTLVSAAHAGISPVLTQTIGLPVGVAVDSNGNVYFDDTSSGNIYRYQP